jgi:hypothetical protein
MMLTRKGTVNARCEWLGIYLKNKLKYKEIKEYNRAKVLIYYFPQLLDGLSRGDFELAMQSPNESYICLSADEVRYGVFDKLYKEKYGKDFVPNSFGETRYITIGDVFKYFKL